MAEKKPAVLVVNIPFCTHRCSFCALPVFTPEGDGQVGGGPVLGPFAAREAYVEALGRELASIAPDLSDHQVCAIRIAGGTPTAVPAQALRELIELAREQLNVAPDAPVEMLTLPGTISADALGEYKRAGIRRFELGVCTTNVFEWSCLDRPVAVDALGQSAALFSCYGISDVGMRVMYGIPGQTTSSLTTTLKAALSFGAQRIWLDLVPLVEGTPYCQRFVHGEGDLRPIRSDVSLPDEGRVGELVSSARKLLAEAGMASAPLGPQAAEGSLAFAIPGHESVAESLLAQGADCVTLGTDGVSLVDGLRTTNIHDLERYIAHADDPRVAVATVEDLTLRRG